MRTGGTPIYGKKTYRPSTRADGGGSPRGKDGVGWGNNVVFKEAPWEAGEKGKAVTHLTGSLVMLAETMANTMRNGPYIVKRPAETQLVPSISEWSVPTQKMCIS